jgi:hypothetical protein
VSKKHRDCLFKGPAHLVDFKNNNDEDRKEKKGEARREARIKVLFEYVKSEDADRGRCAITLKSSHLENVFAMQVYNFHFNVQTCGKNANDRELQGRRSGHTASSKHK